MSLYTIFSLLFIFCVQVLLPNRAMAQVVKLKSCPVANVAIDKQWKIGHPLVKGPDQGYLQAFSNMSLVQVGPSGRFECVFCAYLPRRQDDQIDIEKRGRRRLMKITWKLHPKARWADGTSLTGWDVRFSFEVYRVFVEAGLVPGGTTINSIVVNDKDASEFTVIHSQVRSDFVLDMQFPLLPSIIEEPIWNASKRDPELYLKASLYRKAPRTAGLYNGSFIPQYFQNNEGKLEQKKEIDRLVKNDKFLLFPANKISFCQLDLLKPSQIEKLHPSERDVLIVPEYSFKVGGRHPRTIAKQYNLKSIRKNSGRLEVMAFNLRNPVLSDPQVRRAIFMSLNRGKWGVARSDYLELASEFLPRYQIDSDSPNIIKSDVDKAVEILQKARWVKSKGGSFYKQSKKLQLDLVYSLAPKYRSEIVAAVSRDLNVIGIMSTKKAFAKAKYGEVILRKMDYSDVAIVTLEFLPRVVPKSYFSKKEIPRHSNGYVGNNIFGWHQAFVDDLFKKQLKDFEMKNVRQYANQLHERLAAELPYLPLYWHIDRAFVGRKIGGFQLSGNYLPSSAYAYGWANLVD